MGTTVAAVALASLLLAQPNADAGPLADLNQLGEICITAHGDRLHAEGQWVQAHGSAIRYDPASGLLTLTGTEANPAVFRRTGLKNGLGTTLVISGQRIEYSTKTQKVNVIGGVLQLESNAPTSAATAPPVVGR